MKNINNLLNAISMDVKRTLTKEGFLLSRTNPCYARIRGEQPMACPPDDLGLSFYIINPPIPPVSPFDCSTAHVNLENPDAGGICFQLIFCFYTALAPCLEVDEIQAVYDKHDFDWRRKLSDYLSDIACPFNLSWDTEYDEFIEDSLFGWIPLSKAENILAIMKTLKLKQEKWIQKENTDER